MRILLTTDTVGGVWTFTQELAAGLLRQQHEVALLALGREPSPAQSAWSRQLEAEHTSSFQALFSSAPLEWMEGNAQAFAEGEEALMSLAEVFQPDLLHSSQFCFGALRTGYPRLITAHSDVLSWAQTCRPAGFEPSPWLDTYVGLVENGLAQAHAVAAPTHWMLRQLREHYKQLPTRLSVVANGRSLAGAATGPERKLQAVSVGRLWDEGKNIRLLAQVCSPWPLLVAGDPTFGETAAAADALPNVTWLGVLSETEVLDIFRESSSYLCTSIYEPFGLAPLEAALCGCAVLLNDIPPLRELWGDAALYFRDAHELSAVLAFLASSPDRLAAARQSAHQRALRYTSERMVESYIGLYEELLQDTKQGAIRELTQHAV